MRIQKNIHFLFLLFISTFITSNVLAYDLTISGQLDGDYWSLESIYTSNAASCSVEDGADATLEANEKVILKPGFHAKSGSTFTAKIGTVLDNDNDGMPDEWEPLYDLDPGDPNDALVDDPRDGDGYCNLREYLSNSDPTTQDIPQTTSEWEWRYFSGEITYVHPDYPNPWGIDLDTTVSGSANFHPDLFYDPEWYYVGIDGGSLEVNIFGSLETLSFGSNDRTPFGPYLLLHAFNDLRSINLDEYFGENDAYYFFTPPYEGLDHIFEIKGYGGSTLLRGKFYFNEIIYVDNDFGNQAPGTGKKNDPFHEIQDAINAQDAINGAESKGIIMVADGVYNVPSVDGIDFGGEEIALVSKNGPERTIIDCQGSGRAFYFHTNETNTSILAGFTIKGAANGGIVCESGASPEIKNCLITDNVGAYGGIYCSASSPTITNCLITNNISSSNGGGILCSGGCIPTITNCTIVGNTATSGGGIGCDGSTAFVTNCIIWDNAPDQTSSSPLVTYSDIQGAVFPGVGNITEDPLFRDDYHLHAGSPCINTGDPTFVPQTLPDYDMDREERPKESRYDMGVDEFFDYDLDGMPNYWEQLYGLDIESDADSGVSNDLDILTNLEEYNAGTDPNDIDTDEDGMDDWWELEYLFNPLFNDAEDDEDDDELTNYQEYIIKSDPRQASDPATGSYFHYDAFGRIKLIIEKK